MTIETIGVRSGHRKRISESSHQGIISQHLNLFTNYEWKLWFCIINDKTKLNNCIGKLVKTLLMMIDSLMETDWEYTLLMIVWDLIQHFMTQQWNCQCCWPPVDSDSTQQQGSPQDDVLHGNTACINGPLCRESTSYVDSPTWLTFLMHKWINIELLWSHFYDLSL